MITHCAKCNKPFETYPYKIKRHKHLFCSTVCQHAFRKQRIRLKCRICNLPFDMEKYRVENQIECFCSKKCADKALCVPKIKTNCKTCNKEFEFLESRLKHSNRSYCSVECFQNRELTSPKLNCECCKKEFSISLSAKKSGRGRFCSRSCYASFCVRDKSPSYKHGHGWFKKMTKTIRKNRCEICEKEGKTSIHHIDGNEFNNVDENFITVCHSCHMRIHHLSGRHSIPLPEALGIFKIIKPLPENSHSTWLVVEGLKKK